MARLGVAGHDRIVAGAALAEGFVAGHFQLALLFLGVVAGVAILLENGRDVIDEADGPLGLRVRRRYGAEQQEPGQGQAEQGAEETIAARRAKAEHRETPVGEASRGALAP